MISLIKYILFTLIMLISLQLMGQGSLKFAIGAGSSTLSGFSCFSSLSAEKKANVITLRIMYNIESTPSDMFKYTQDDSFSEIALLYGRSFPISPHLNSSFSIGPSYYSHTAYYYTGGFNNSRKTANYKNSIGLAGQFETNYFLNNYLGLGLTLFGNLNNSRSLFGGIVNINFLFYKKQE